ncbi:MAG: STAS domain-containing protein [bacterium]
MRTKKQDGLLIITPNSELNASTIAKAAMQLQRALQKADDSSAVLLDLRETVSYDSATLKLLLAARGSCQKLGLGLRLHTSEAGKKFLTLLRLQRDMSITMQEADV